MQRTVHLSHFPFQTVSRLITQGQHNVVQILTANPRAARALGKPHQALSDLAKTRLSHAGIGIASAMMSRKLLKEAVQEAASVQSIDGIASTLELTIRELFRTGSAWRLLANNPSPRISSLAYIANLYCTKLRQHGLIDVAELFTEAIAHIEAPLPLILYGYSHLVPDEKQFLQALAGHGSHLILPYAPTSLFDENHETAMAFQAEGWQLERDQAVENPLSQCFLFKTDPPSILNSFVFGDRDAEVRAALGQVKTLLSKGITTKEIVLVTRDETLYGPTLLSVAWEYDIPVRLLYHMTLAETRLGTWLRLLIDSLSEGLGFETTFQFLTHQFSPPLPQPVKDAVKRYHPNTLGKWQQHADLPEMDWPKTETMSQWVKRLQTFMTTLEIEKQVAPWAQEACAYNTLITGLETLQKERETPISKNDFLSELQEILSLLTLPIQPGRGGVELHTPLTLLGARYAHVIVLGMIEGVMPAAIKNDLRLDFFDRQLLVEKGIPMRNVEKASRDEALIFYALLQVATASMTFSYPKILDDKETLPSPYFDALNQSPQAQQSPIICSLEEMRQYQLLTLGEKTDDPVLKSAYQRWQIEHHREISPTYDNYDGLTGISINKDDRAFSIIELQNFGQCHFRWFAEKQLHLSQDHEATDELDPLRRGNLYHKTLELLCRWASETEDTQTSLKTRIEEAFLQAESMLDLKTLATWPIQRQEHLARLKKLVNTEDFLPEGHRFLSLEAPFTSPWEGLTVTGKVDRIDETPRGLVLIDYKTSSSKPKGIQDDEGKLTLDLQLALYAQAALPSLFPGKALDKAYYYSVTKGSILKKYDTQDLSDLSHFAQTFQSALASGSFVVRPDTKQEACKLCDFDLVCRQGARLQNKIDSDSSEKDTPHAPNA